MGSTSLESTKRMLTDNEMLNVAWNSSIEPKDLFFFFYFVIIPKEKERENQTMKAQRN